MKAKNYSISSKHNQKLCGEIEIEMDSTNSCGKSSVYAISDERDDRKVLTHKRIKEIRTKASNNKGTKSSKLALNVHELKDNTYGYFNKSYREDFVNSPNFRRFRKAMNLETQPILDQGQASQAHIDNASEQHRNVYVGLPASHDKHKHHKHQKRRFKGFEKSSGEEKPALPPSQQVQFILGGEKHGGEVDENEVLCWCCAPCLFIEMQQLKIEEGGETLWRETARWIKFEECVEEGGDRWSKPHVSTLSLQSVHELRSCLIKGVVQLDMQASDFTQITDLVLEQMVSNGNLPHDAYLTASLRKMILSGFEHQGERKKGVTAITSVADFVARRDSQSQFKALALNQHSSEASALNRHKTSMTEGNDLFTGLENGDNQASTDNDKKNKVPYLMKKIPHGAEAFNVMVGEVDVLEEQVVAFVRLQDSTLLGRLVEVPIPSRFLFLLLGPSGSYKQNHEIGRSIATLMIDEVFHEVAYKAKSRNDLLSGIDEFLQHVTLLPPGGWNATTRIEPPKDLPGNQKKRLVSKSSIPMSSPGDTKEDMVVHEVNPGLQRTGRLFGGLIDDIKRRAPHYKSDFTDCLSIQCLASFIFLYFAILTPIVTFGGLLGDATHNYLGTMESIFGGAMSGIAYHVFSGQPLTIIGSTGPILVFEKIMFDLCEVLGFKYIAFRVWVGVWTGFICLLLVAFDASSLISYVTRYTEESFSALISLIFIYEAFKKLMHEEKRLHIWYGWEPEKITLYECNCHPPNLTSLNITTNITFNEMSQRSKEIIATKHSPFYEGLLFRTDEESYLCAYQNNVTNISNINSIPWENFTRTECVGYNCGQLIGESCKYTPDAILMSLVLFFGTFTISMFLKGMKTSRYFPTKVRSIISDFAVTIGIGLMVILDLVMDINTSKLTVPPSFRPTRDDRTWLIDPFESGPWWSCLVAIIPALLATILIFMDQQITAVIVNRKENKLKKGCGYHLDLFVVSIMLIICSILGLPWFVAATVLSITHVNSLRMESETSAPGETAKFLGIREQRVTGIMIFLMIGVSIFLTPVLVHIPMPVLYGVFLYMGVSSLQGVQFFDRLKLFFMPPKHQPDFIYLRHVPLPKVYLFTFFQVLGLAVLWIIKSSPPVSIIFPMMVAALVGIRKLFDFFFFSQQELMWLDDIIPEFTKKKKEDAKKKDEDKTSSYQKETNGNTTLSTSSDGEKMLKFPMSDFTYKSNNGNNNDDLEQAKIPDKLGDTDLENHAELRNRSLKLAQPSDDKQMDGQNGSNNNYPF